MNGVYWSQNLALQWCEFCPVGSRLDWRALREKKKKKGTTSQVPGFSRCLNYAGMAVYRHTTLDVHILHR